MASTTPKVYRHAESKPLKFMYFMSDACTCKILKVLNSFATRSSGQRNEHFYKLFYIFIFHHFFDHLTLQQINLKLSKFCYVHALLMKYMDFNGLDLSFEADSIYF